MNSTWFDSETCTDYSCIYDREANDISIVEKTGFLNFLFSVSFNKWFANDFSVLGMNINFFKTIASRINIQSQHLRSHFNGHSDNVCNLIFHDKVAKTTMVNALRRVRERRKDATSSSVMLLPTSVQSR